MIVNSFLNVMKRFRTRADLFTQVMELSTEVIRLSRVVRDALCKQLSIALNTDDDLTAYAGIELDNEATAALQTLCRYLDEKDRYVDYWKIAQQATA